MNSIENVVIIGGGVAGLTAAIYAGRAGFSPLVFAGSPPGGQMSLTSNIENFPGQAPIMGAELVIKIREQAKRFGARIVDENVVEVDFSQKPFKIHGSIPNFFDSGGSPAPIATSQVAKKLGSSPIATKTVIIATGAKALWLGLPSEKKFIGRGISACAICDGFFFRDKTVAVVGGGDTALHEALTLAKLAKKVYVIHRRGEFRACKLLQQQLFANKKIEVVWNAQVEEVLGETKVEGIKLKILNLKFQILKLNGLFIAIGRKPDTDLFKSQIKLDKNGYILTHNFNYHTATSVEGVFAAGDCADFIYQQAVVAAGTGAMAALDAQKYLEKI